MESTDKILEEEDLKKGLFDLIFIFIPYSIWMVCLFEFTSITIFLSILIGIVILTIKELET